jgi:hypothetical protein
MSNSKNIETRRQTLKLIPWNELKNYDSNSLKESGTRDISKLKKAILNSKFSFPFYTWNNYIIDGAGRMIALLELEKEGYKISDLPIIEIQAENKREAKKLVLETSSDHGTVTRESYEDFVNDLDLSELELEEINFDLFDVNYNLQEYDSLSEEEEISAHTRDPRRGGNVESLEFNDSIPVVIYLTKMQHKKLELLKNSLSIFDSSALFIKLGKLDE